MITSPGEMAIDNDVGPTPVEMRVDFDAFYRAEADGLYRALSLALGDPQLGAEAADEALARAYQRWRRISRYDNPAGWAYRVGLNWARNRLRNRRREVLTDEAVDRAVTGAAGDDPAVARAIAGLPLKIRSVVVLRYYLDWSTAQVAAALEIPEGTVKSRLSNGLASLEQALEEDA